jgi:hypothetical protein
MGNCAISMIRSTLVRPMLKLDFNIAAGKARWTATWVERGDYIVVVMRINIEGRCRLVDDGEKEVGEDQADAKGE